MEPSAVNYIPFSGGGDAMTNLMGGHIGSVLFGLVGTTTCVEVRPLNSCSTAQNPSYSGVAIPDSNSFGGAVGTLLDTLGPRRV